MLAGELFNDTAAGEGPAFTQKRGRAALVHCAWMVSSYLPQPVSAALGLTQVGWMTIIIVIMMPRSRFVLIYAPVVKQHLRVIEPRHHSLIRVTIEEQLRDQPDTRTRNRKPLRRPAASDADWELRFGPSNQFRVFYRVDRQEGQVRILAIGIKERNRLFIGGEEIAE